MGVPPVTGQMNAEFACVLEDYFTQRRALGFHLIEEESHVRRFLGCLWDNGNSEPAFDQREVLAWVRGDGSFKASYEGQRLSAVRGFARFARGLGFDVEVPSPKMLPAPSRRLPHIYTQAEVDALIGACQEVFVRPLVQTTMAMIIKLLAVTGMRIGEALRLAPNDLVHDDQTLVIRANKHGPDRVIPLHADTMQALAAYERCPQRLAASPHHDGSLLVTVRGGPYSRTTVESHFQKLREAAGVNGNGTNAPRLHDLRHTFATRQMIRSYTEPDGQPARMLSLLSVWLGHSDPSHTYWYVHAVPELLALAARRLPDSTTNATDDDDGAQP